MAVGEQLKRKVEAVQETWLVQWFAFLPRCPWLGVKENLAGSDLARAFCWLALSSNLRQHKKQSLQNDLQRLDLRLPPAAELVKMALNKPETELLAKKAAATLEKQVEKQMENLKAAGLDEKALQAFAQKAGTKLGAIHV
ncbi:unnamed protein product [Symbiodinium natans]|uniref:Uncharacterized protein n=1 Tax=Symbiodinium natans TaxID=878477 RepID=A0A812SL59_9DINO|nr:unnamed protein product [Symbiodinium natans]